MNNIFKKDKDVLLDENYSLNTDGDNGITLIFQEERKKENKSGGTEKFIFKDTWYFPMVGQALSKYVELTSKKGNTIDEINANIKKVLKVVEEFRLKYKNW